MRVPSRRRSESGFVAIEWVAAIAMLLLPIVVLVATMPGWAERRHAATVAAREAARDLVDNWPNGDPGRRSSSRETSRPITESMPPTSMSACLQWGRHAATRWRSTSR